MKKLRMKLSTLCIFRDLLKDEVIEALCAYLKKPNASAYAEFVSLLYKANGGNLGEYIKEICSNSDNVYVRTIGMGKNVPSYMLTTIEAELDTLQEVAELTKDELCLDIDCDAYLPDFTTTK